MKTYPEKQKKSFLIIDGNALLHRAWHAIPLLTSEKGEVVNAVYGFTMTLMKVLKDIRPTYIVVTFDRKAPTFRHKAYAAYKATRVKQPDELYQQIDHIRSILEAFGISVFEKDGFEADDIIATLKTRARKEDAAIETIILTGDMDALQLVDEKTNVYAFRKGLTDFTVYTIQAVQERYGGLTPNQLVEYKALRGDPSDNIPGVKGVGEKTAIELIKQYGSIKELYKNLRNTKIPTSLRASVVSRLDTSEKEAYESLMLVTLVYNVPIDFSLQKTALNAVDTERLYQLFREFNFKSLIPRLKEFGRVEQEYNFRKKEDIPSTHCQVVDTDKEEQQCLTELRTQDVVTFFIHEGVANLFTTNNEGLVFHIKDKRTLYVPWKRVQESKSVIAYLEDEHAKKICHDSKTAKNIFFKDGITLRGVVCDTLLAAYIIHPGTREYALDGLIYNEYGKTLDEVNAKKVSELRIVACTRLEHISSLADVYAKTLQELHQEFLFNTIELPLVDVLLGMEREGVKLDGEFLEKLSKKITADIHKLEETIYALAGGQFNIASPVQLKKILFEKLELSTFRIRKGKTGLSTAASELEKMRHLHPVIEYIFEFRELAKLKNTYVDALPKLINPKTGRLHTQFNQTIAATGRLSSSNPNLQNIPIKTSVGKEMRKAFVAEKGYLLVSADYSQVELRIIASLANDTKMIHAFKRGIDIHTATAAEINGVTLEDVTPSMRRAAKEINFGIMYGMSAQGLAESAKISFTHAQDFIDRYFLAYPAIRTYMDEVIVRAKKDGYSATHFGRRRYLPELQSHIFQLRSSAERMAINMPIQGTAADIMKLAMIAVHNRLHVFYKNRKKKPATMILQVHDELVFEVQHGHEKELADLVRKEMEGIAQFAVPLLVETYSGVTWGDMKKL